MSFFYNLNLGKNGSTAVPSVEAPDIRTTYGSGVRPHAVDFADDVWALGWFDGREGQPWSDAERVFRARSRLFANNRRKDLARELAESQGRADALEGQVAASRAELARVAEQATKVDDARLAHPGRFSLGLGWVLLGVAVALFLSDVPLSLKLVADGFRIPSDVEHPVLGLVTTSDLLRHPLVVLGYLWEPLLLAIGIAFAGILLKVYLDDGWEPYGRANKKVILLLTPAVAILVLSLVLVAQLRAQRSEIDAQAEEDMARMWIPEVGQVGAAGSEAAGGGDAGSEVEKEKEDEEDAAVDISYLAFLFLTLTLPIVGGVLFSAGWTRLQNGMQLRRLRRRESMLREEVTKSLVEERSLRRHAELLGMDLTESPADMPEAGFWSALHRHGYLRGAVADDSPPTEGLYAACERVFARALRGAERARVWKSVEEVNLRQEGNR